MDRYQFPQKNVLCDEKPFSRELLHSLLETVYTVAPPFTGYLKIAGSEGPLLFLFFLHGSPYAAGRYADRPICYSLQELGEHLVKSADESRFLTLCETDPVLLKSMLLFLQEVPAIKAPTSLIDIEYIVRQIGEVGADALITLDRANTINFFYFREGKEGVAYFADLAFERHEGMTVDEEMQLYAFQPGNQVQASIYRDMTITMAKDSSLLDKDALFKLLTEGNPKNRRREDREPWPKPAVDVGGALVNAPDQKMRLSNYVLSIESGPLKGGRFAVTLPCTIGRGDCDLILDDRLISRRHAEIKMVDDQLVIEDLASTNGTKVNGEMVTSKRLIPNDLISIGPTDLKIYLA